MDIISERETKNLEYKENISNTFLKTVSAFANYGTGVIKFGITDKGHVIGVSNPFKACLAIENKINDNIQPMVNYTLSVEPKTNVITLCVKEGFHKPYFYNGKAYKRNDSSSIQVDYIELTRLILDGKNISFEELKSSEQDLKFDILSQKLKSHLHLNEVNMDTLKTLQLFSEDQFNNAASLLSDVNNFSGIEIVRYGANINTILDRKSFTHQSILLQYENAISVFETYYQYEEIKGAFREKKELVPLKAFREAIANAIVHRVYDIDANISVFMFDDRIEIISPGGLPHGVRREDYLKGGISIFRNHIIGNLFLRLCMIEKLGTGIRRINESYSSSMKMPSFDTSENSIRITLPVLVKKNNLSLNENKIYDALKNQNLSSSIIAEKAGYGKTKTVSILNKFLQEGYIVSTGKGRAKRYQLKQNI